MSLMNPSVEKDERSWRSDPAGRFIALLTTLVAGIILGIQYWTPNKRVIPVVVAIGVFGIAWRLSMMAAVNLLVFLLPYPKGTVFGSTNLAFILLVFVIWLLRVSLRMNPRPRSTPVDLPIAAFLLWGVLSFYNIQNEVALGKGLSNYLLLVASVIYFYLIINNVRTPRDLERFNQAQLITAFGIFVFAFIETRFPGRVIIPGLIDFTATTGSEFNTRDVRVGSSFRDYELLSEYCGLMFLLCVFHLVRARTQISALILSLLTLFALYTMFTTVTRGVIIALALALPIAFYSMRKRLNPVKFITAVSGILALAIVMNAFVATYTNTGDLFLRLSETKVVHGVMPEAREETWTNAWNRALVHPILGQGPYYDEMVGYSWYWPHNVYLYIANLYGFPGLIFFLTLMFGIWRLIRPTTDDIRHESYPDAFMILARTQFVMFALNELKIDFLRNPIYQFQVWQLFGTWTVAYLVSREHGLLARNQRSEPSPAPSPAPLRAAS